MSGLRLLTQPEIFARMMAVADGLLDITDFNVGSFLRAIYEAASLSDADQYVQIGKAVDLWDLDNCKGDDLDRRGLEMGAKVFPEMRRRPAITSIGNVVVGDGAVQRFAKVVGDVAATQIAFNIDDSTNWPVAGAAVIARGTLREETVSYIRTGLVINVISPASGVVNPHLDGETVETVATRSKLVLGIIVGATTATIQAGTESVWGASGTVIFERDTVRRESRAYTRVGQDLTFAATTFAHAAGSDVTLSTFGSDRAIGAGTVAFAPESEVSKRVSYRTTAAGTLLDGDYVSALIPVESEEVGRETMVGSQQIRKWQTEPFANATVSNPLPTIRGSDQEEDIPYRNRLRLFITALSRATALALEQLLGGKRDDFSNLVIAFAQAVEPVAPGKGLLYVTDGSPTFTIDYQEKRERYVIISDARVNDKRGRLGDLAPYQQIASPLANRTPRIYKSNQRGVATLVGANFLEDSSQSFTVNALTGMYLKTDDNQFYLITSNTAIRINVAAGGATPSLGSYSVFAFDTTDPMIPGVDYTFNESNGDLELVVPLVEHDGLVAAPSADLTLPAYIYSRGLAAYAQRLVNGDRTDLSQFPGIKAHGCHIQIVVPTVISPSFLIQVVTEAGIADSELVDRVKSVVLAYVNSLGIGQQVILSEIVRLIKELAGVHDVRVLEPTSNPAIADGQIPRITESDISVV